jgi:hypothetical protein
VAVGALAASVALVVAAPAVAARPAQLAIVIGNNLPDTRDRALLRYADDDAIAMHRLLLEAGVTSYLLASPDADTRALNPKVRVTGAPRWSDLERVIGSVAAELTRARAQGRPTEVLFYFSGHGDVADGEGYLALGDRRLTRTLLFERVLARLPTARRHVIVDACKSYLLAAPRGAGGSRSELAGGFLATRRASLTLGTGFLLSTSSARDSHEWERYQSGVFSHQLRSALRGAADVNGDGAIVYAEIGSFLRAASRAIANPLLRPDFTLRAPSGDLATPLVLWPRQRAAGATRLTVDREQGTHLFVESRSGLRLADLPPARGELRIVLLPAERPLYFRRQDGSLEYPLEIEGDARLSELAPRPTQLARKGALNAALEQLFSTPFGQADVVRYQASYSQELLEERLAQRVALEDDAREQGRRRWRRRAGVTALSAGILGLALGAVALERYASAGSASQVERERRNPVIRGLGVTSAVLGGVAAAAGTAWLVLTLRSRSPVGVSLSPDLRWGALGARVAVHGW